MDAHESGWFSSQELEYLQDPESVDAKHRSTVRGRIEEKVNDEVISDLERLPDLIEFLDQSTRESLPLQSDPAAICKGLGEIYSDQTIEMIFGILLSEQKPDEPTEDFLERVNTIWDEVKAEIHQLLPTSRLSFDTRQTFGTLQRALLDKIAARIDATCERSGVKMRVPRDEFIGWIVARGELNNLEYIPDVVDAAYGLSTEKLHPQRLGEYWYLLTLAAEDQGLEPPVDEEWTFDVVDPSDDDYKRHETALSALDDELVTATYRYWDEAQIRERDQLLALGLLTQSRLQKRDRQILDRIPCSNRTDGWNRYDTRRANVLTDELPRPVLSREITPKRGTNEKQYTFTDYGRFVYWLAEYVEEKDTLSAVLWNFVRDAPYEITKSANDWVTEHIEGARRDDVSPESAQDTSAGCEREETDLGISNSILWMEVAKEIDVSEWEDP